MDYPCYQLARGPNLGQGDILESCPVFLPRADRPPAETDSLFFDEELRDVMVVSQTCDLVAGREKLSEVLLCPVWSRSQLVPPHYLATARGLEEARRGVLPGFQLLAVCGLAGFFMRVGLPVDIPPFR